MDPLQRKIFIECPRCRGMEVSVPWEPMRLHTRRKLNLSIILVLAISVVEVFAGAILKKWLLLILPLPISVLLIIALYIGIYRNMNNYKCASCRLRWTM